MEIEKLVKKMMIEDPFYGFMLTTLERRFTDRVARMGVTFNHNMNAELLINKEFYETLTDVEQLACLKHELLHLAFHHLTMMNVFPNKEIANIAMDLEVNGYITGLPSWVYRASDYNLNNRLGTMAYYRALTQPQQQQKQQGNPDKECNGGADPSQQSQEPGDSTQNHQQNGQNQQDDSQDGDPEQKDQGQQQLSAPKPQQGFDKEKAVCDHNVWEEGADEAQENVDLINSVIDDMLIRAANSVKTRGFIPAELAQYISELEKPLERVFDWKKAFRRFLGNSYTENKKSSRRKESRRFVGAAGSKHTKRAEVLVAIDTSGSVNEYELHEFFSELTYMYKTGTKIHVLECDAAIQHEYDYKPGCVTQVHGRGGTRFEPVIDYYKEHYKRYETLIYFTDGEASLNFTVPQNNMLWVISSQGSKNDYPGGKVIYIPKRNH